MKLEKSGLPLTFEENLIFESHLPGVPGLRKLKPKKLFSKIPFIAEQPLYKSFIKDPEEFLFLSKPQDFPNFFKGFLK